MRYWNLWFVAVYLAAALLTTGCSGDAEKKESVAELASTKTTSPGSQQKERTAPRIILLPDDDEKIINAARSRMQAMDYPIGYELELFANEQATQNPAFFTFDEKGRLLTTEIARIWHGAEDIRGHHHLVEQDIRIQSLEDRLEMMKGNADKLPMSFYTEKADRVRTLTDINQDGRAEKSQLFVESMNDQMEGIASGLLTRDDTVYLANIPHIWKLKDGDQDGVAEIKEPLHSGFGIRFSFNGHDLHGLAWGPDGKLYWTLGDRGYNFVSREGKHFYGPNLGGVFRSNPDGSDIELFYTGLRNPQELVFDQYGNLFTGDNDGDGGDIERVNYLIEGGDSGWHAGFQSLMTFAKTLELRSYKYAEKQSLFNPWMDQQMWKVRNDNQPAFILPGIAQLDGGPSGFTYNPGGSWGERLRNSFFLVLFKGAPSETYISRFKLKADGASYALKSSERFWGGFNAADVEFGPNGKLYASEFNYSGWGPQNQGAFYTLSPTDQTLQKRMKQDEGVLLTAFDAQDTSSLLELLNYDHQKVRQRAQFALAKRPEAVDALIKLALDVQREELARLHALWALGQMATAGSDTADRFLSQELMTTLVNDEKKHLRAQAAKLIGDHKLKNHAQTLTNSLSLSSPKFTMHALVSLGKLEADDAHKEVATLLQRNQAKDLWIRHAGVMYLYGVSEKVRRIFAESEAAALRLPALLAYRKKSSPELANFLEDKDLDIVEEAITALHDIYPDQYQAELAAYLPRYLDRIAQGSAKVRADIHLARLINANYRLGSTDAAQRILGMLERKPLSASIASEALAAVEAWQDVNGIDTLIGLPSKAQKSRADISKLVQAAVPSLVQELTGQPLAQAIRLAEKYDYALPTELLVRMVSTEENLIEVRGQALNSLLAQNYDGIKQLAHDMTSSTSTSMRAIALGVLARVDVPRLYKIAKQFIDSGSVPDYQAALKTLAALEAGQDKTQAIRIAGTELDKLESGTLRPEVMLEVRELVDALATAKLEARMEAYDAKFKDASMEQQFADSRVGGSIESGRALFKSGGAGECMRCHIINWEGGNVGPDLSEIGETKDHAYLLRAIVDPGSEIASGYGVMTVTTKQGDTLSGTYLGHDDASVQISMDDEPKTFSRDNLESIIEPVSGMPPMQYFISRREIRDLVAYLHSLKAQKEGH